MKKGPVNREPSSATRIRFQDPLGHLNNARYLDYFINAREDHLAECWGVKSHCRYLMDLFAQKVVPASVHKAFDARVRNIFQKSLKAIPAKGGSHV